MIIENVMYFALGLLAAGFLALMLMPAIWRRAVRLTKKRIEAATPMTMAEFRADKDQLRAEFALSTRRLEKNVETLRRRLAEQLRDVSTNRTDLGAIKEEREKHLAIVRELEEREGELRRRVLELEKESTDLAQRLRMRDREFADKVEQLEIARMQMQEKRTGIFAFDGRALSGEYDKDVAELIDALEQERRRAGHLETQIRGLITQLERADKRGLDAAAASAELRRTLARRSDETSAVGTELVAAEARIADAENRVNAILLETTRVVAESEERQDQLLADKLGLEAEVEALRQKVLSVEETVMADWDTDRIEQSHLREKLNDIASDVSRLVYAMEGHGPADAEESLFDRVQRFADDGMGMQDYALPANDQAPRLAGTGPLSDRISALRNLQDQK
ncbi:hypothetical protein EMQ25_01705 [Arsenicitalea aurantiaca]|uniref:Uncharacterized protein n=1 Tax=Arsenicitalea aurantiaca TaxID=1783274 RepID=A0A433XL01_9HYPH|nr:hypothetical protein [Arsenicitalea aurantiaca]RUT34704.1 hypothetical protein EMQ25_01705 [Arsenicitalea aurantiaca]